MLEYVSCMLCGQDGSSPYYVQGEWLLVRCDNCGLVYLNPRPDTAELDRLYSKSYFINNEIQHDHTDDSVEAEVEVRLSSAKRIVQEISGDCSWLDIGCGSGYLLAAARSIGCDTQGIEISSWAADFGVSRLKLPIFNGRLSNFYELHDGVKFSIITMMAYLEHSRDPLNDLRVVSSMLTDQGVVVIRVPDVSSFDRYWHGKKWRGWSLPFHLYHFTQHTLNMTLLKAGLKNYRAESIFWNPILHLKNAITHSDLRWDSPLEGRVRPGIEVANKKVQGSQPPLWKIYLMNGLSRILKGRDMIVYAKKTS